MSRTTNRPRTATAHSAGGVVMAVLNSEPRFLLIKNSFDGRWTIPKGHLDPGETSEQAAVREIQEETGLDSEIIGSVGKNTYHFRWREKLVRKRVDVYVLRATGSTELVPEQFDPLEKLVADARWFSADQVVGAVGYKNMQPLIQKAVDVGLATLKARQSTGSESIPSKSPDYQATSKKAAAGGSGG